MIYIIGVEHFTVQLPNETNDKGKVAQFLDHVRNICRERSITLIAEESSNDSLVYQQIDATHVGKIVPELNIEYFLCDPGLVERKRIGIKQRQTIATELSIPFPPATKDQEDKINEIAAASDRIREKYWLDEIKSRNGMNRETLLICGFEHVDSFIEIARKENLAVQKSN
jgi:hypothetical protein